ncbi:M56 family metallopeptidase [Nonlabens ulvanivorans]|uniref:M56 family metallopeptidase n=1 Tax=Nonlabens ulvanivorans TaxID=906888 RepID=UPI002942D467|nr:M56 family metallopeptidase [Nonlabens ulvanivorans]WOI23958.1 M56 family metallopeptidase [Nonlabens ulvanivorans]
MENYITTTIILFTIATLIYELLLKNTTFFTTNRLYLIAIPVLLWFVPFINIETLNQEPEGIPIAPSSHVVSQMTFNKFQTATEPKYQSPTPQAPTLEEPTVTFSWWWIYFAGAFISLLWFIKNYYQLSLLQSAGKECETNGIKYYRISDSNIALSFLGKILIGEQIEEHQLDTILEHEQVHIVQNHHLDLLFFQVLNIVLWFNPFNYLFLNRLKLTHELLADAAVANQIGKQHYTELLLNKRFATSDIPFANMFFNIKTIKTRISMLYKDSSPKIASVRYLSLLLLLTSAVVYTSCTTIKEKEPTLENQISELNNRIKVLDSISLKDLNSLYELQNVITSYCIDEGFDFAKITSKDDLKIIDSIYRTLKAKDSMKLKAFNQTVTRKEYSEFVEWARDSIDRTKARITEDGKTLTFDYKKQENFILPLYSEFKFGQKDYYKGISEEDKLWYKNYDYNFWDSKKDIIIDSTNAKQLVKDFATYRRTKEGMRYFEIKRQITTNGTSIVIDDSKEPKDIMTIIENPNGKVLYGTFPSQGETGLSDIKYEIFKHWALQNYPSLKQTVVYSEGAIKDYYNGKYNE